MSGLPGVGRQRRVLPAVQPHRSDSSHRDRWGPGGDFQCMKQPEAQGGGDGEGKATHVHGTHQTEDGRSEQIPNEA